MKDLLSIDHLDDLSGEEITEVLSGISVRTLLIEQLKLQGKKTGLTLDQFNEEVAGLEPRTCRACSGAGEHLPPPPREVGVIHPSSAYSCVLRLYYDVTGEKVPISYIPPELQFTFQIGHAIHDEVQRALHNLLDGDFEDEVQADMVGFVRGNCDGLLYLTIPGYRVKILLEIKTAGPSDFDGLRAPLEPHRVQANGLYATALDAPIVVYLYISKIWPHPIKEYVEIYSPGLFKVWWKNKGSKVEKAVKARAAGDPSPEPVADSKPSDCAGCPYDHDCPQSLSKRSKSNTAFRKGK